MRSLTFVACVKTRLPVPVIWEVTLNLILGRSLSRANNDQNHLPFNLPWKRMSWCKLVSNPSNVFVPKKQKISLKCHLNTHQIVSPFVYWGVLFGPVKKNKKGFFLTKSFSFLLQNQQATTYVFFMNLQKKYSILPA